MAKRKKDIQIIVNVDPATREVRIKIRPDEIIVKRIPVEPPNQKQGESYERRY